MSIRRSRALALYTVVAVLVLLVPAFVLAIFSFNADRFPSMPWRGTTLQWYRIALSDTDLLSAIVLSLKLGLFTSIASVILGSSAAWGLLRVRTTVAIPVASLFALPFLVPGLILGLSTRMASAQFGITNATIRVLIIHTLVFSPLVFALTYARLSEVSKHLEPVAQDLGCGLVQAIWRLHIPLALPTLGGAAILVFALSWDEFILSWMLLNVDATLPVRIWGMMEGAISPEINAIGTLTLACTVPLFGFALWLLRRRPTNQ